MTMKLRVALSAGARTVRAAQDAPRQHGFHRVSSKHRLYYEIHGNLRGPVAVVLHGGPGAGSPKALANLFDLEFWKVVLFDQRGCGRSVPLGLLKSNDPRKIVGDLEKLRHQLKIEKWMVFGGSYGTTLALAYAQLHGVRVSGLVLRAVCLMQQKELDWLFSPTGAALTFPQGWRRFLSILQPNEQRQPIKAYYNRMLSLDDRIREQAARYWREWTMMITFANLSVIQHEHIPLKKDDLLTPPVNLTRNLNLFNNRSLNNVADEVKAMPKHLVQSLIEAHFFYNNEKFITKEFPLLSRVSRLKSIPSIAIHGKLDPVCQKSNALELKRAWKELDLRLIDNGGHSQFDPLIKEATIEAIEEIKTLIQQEKEEEDEYHDLPPEPTYLIPEPQYKKKYR